MAEYQTSWWEFTGRRSPRENGVSRAIYRNLATGEETDDLPIGALFDTGPDFEAGHDGKSIVCVIPSSLRKRGKTYWYIDGRATNCTMPDDNEHRCWVRHGTVGDLIHVDKDGHTCAAGAGSIAVTGFHGFLHHGVLRDC